MAIKIRLSDPDEVTDPGHLEALRRLEMIAAYTSEGSEAIDPRASDRDVNAMATSGAWASPAYEPKSIGAKASKKLLAMYSK